MPGSHAPYPEEFRRRMVELVRFGRNPEVLAKEFEPSALAEYLSGELGAAFAPPELLRRPVAEGTLGRKSGEGFYRWPR